MQNLNNSTKVDIVQNYLKIFIFKIDVIYIQEHELRGLRLVAVKLKFWLEAGFFNKKCYNLQPYNL